jgi:2-polyprenyl-3-methyl-5-hydroxy-6-metoxy-1,4-benzoquinol methylase
VHHEEGNTGGGPSSVYRIDAPLADEAADTWRDVERTAFDEQYAREGSGPIRVDDDETFRPTITPPWEEGGTLGGLVQGEAYRRVLQHGVADRDVLDYGCGLGKWSIQLARRGARVSGFDLSSVAIARARARAEFNGLTIRFDAADAARLPYEDAAFDVAVGIGVLHHVVKYPGTATELRRVLRPGGLAVFTEGLSENPVIELGRRLTMRDKEAAGDVGLTLALVDRWAAPASFARAEVIPVSMLLMAKRVVHARPLLRVLAAADRRLLGRWPRLGRYAGDCLVVLNA